MNLIASSRIFDFENLVGRKCEDSVLRLAGGSRQLCDFVLMCVVSVG